MFNFGKEKLNDRAIGGILINVGMFQSWTLDKRGIDLSSSALDIVIRNLFDNNNFKYTENDVYELRFLALSNLDIDQLRAFREQTGFDSRVKEFCIKMKLPIEYGIPTL